MGINGISAAYYQAGYMNIKPANNTVASSFKATISEKAASEKIDYDERAFEYLGPNAPEEVKKAWMEAAKETGANGMGMDRNGKLTHISAMMSIRLTNQLKGNWNSVGKGDLSGGDLLGGTVSSALTVARQALYDLEHPLSPISQRRIEVQQQIAKEKEFYKAFVNKLEQL